MTLGPCPYCGKTHRQFATADKCKQKHVNEQCSCPEYWKKRPWGHSVAHGCPLA